MVAYWEEKIKKHVEDPYWRNMNLLLAQARAMWSGARAALLRRSSGEKSHGGADDLDPETTLSWEAFLMIQFSVDNDEIEQAIKLQEMVVPEKVLSGSTSGTSWAKTLEAFNATRAPSASNYPVGTDSDSQEEALLFERASRKRRSG